jgi:hypothetical protein
MVHSSIVLCMSGSACEYTYAFIYIYIYIENLTQARDLKPKVYQTIPTSTHLDSKKFECQQIRNYIHQV